MLVNIAPIIPLFLPVRDAAWQLFVPAMAQQSVMMKGLRGEAIGAFDVLVPGAIALALAALALAAQARLLTNERIVFSR
jgi:sodium transport system permease protein